MKKSRKIILLIVLLIGVGFAFLSTNSTFMGLANINAHTWDVYFDNIQVVNGSVSASTPTIANSNTEVDFSVVLTMPGDSYSFTVDCINDGDTNALLDTVSMSELGSDISKLFRYTVTYVDGTEVKKDDLLEAGSQVTYLVTIEYRKDIEAEDLADDYIDLNLYFSAKYVPTKRHPVTYGQVWEFAYTGSQSEFTVPYNGDYTLEVWGAEGGSVAIDGTLGGYGGYSVGTISLNANDKLYVNVGGKGADALTVTNQTVSQGGYNGGGSSGADGATLWAAGGGATHIALDSGILSSLSSHAIDNRILIVAGGGGGAGKYGAGNPGGHGGGYVGVDGNGMYHGVGGNQTTGGNATGTDSQGQASRIISGSFGQGSPYFYYTSYSSVLGGGGGGGYYGGGSGYSGGSSGAGGSGYIANANLDDKAMYCYNCTESSAESTKTVSTNQVSQMPVSHYAKKGNGHARIMNATDSDILIKYLGKETNSVNINNFKVDNKTGVASFNTSLNNTTDYLEFTIEIINSSDVGYFISNIVKSQFDSSKVSYTLTYADGNLVQNNNALIPGARESIVVHLQLLDNSYSIQNQEFTFCFNYKDMVASGEYTRMFWNYDYTGEEEEFIVPNDGVYRLEVWGAQGGYAYNSIYLGGYGGYSTGVMELEKNTKLYINVGGQGANANSMGTVAGGYNGGAASAYGTSWYSGAGGGATHIALDSGLLKNLSSHATDNRILIVAGGGGGSVYVSSSQTGLGGAGGGYLGNSGTKASTGYGDNPGGGGTQSSGGTKGNTGYVGSFGQGGAGPTNTGNAGGGGGGGYFGGGGSHDGGGGGGSGYIANANLDQNSMYCYNCTESNVESTKTISTINVNEIPTSNYAKIGNGYVKITYLGNS